MVKINDFLENKLPPYQLNASNTLRCVEIPIMKKRKCTLKGDWKDRLIWRLLNQIVEQKIYLILNWKLSKKEINFITNWFKNVYNF